MLSSYGGNQESILFEIGWEVANKVGGIYTVIKTKIPSVLENVEGDYILIGPYFQSSMREVEACDPIGSLKEVITSMNSESLGCVYGTWLVDGSPSVILLDTSSCRHMTDDIICHLSRGVSLPIDRSDHELMDAIIFGYMVYRLLEKISSILPTAQIAGHFHEWLGSTAILHMKAASFHVPTIFTTHATILGRHLCAGDVDFYNALKDVDVDFEAGRRGIYTKYCLERAIAHNCDVFTSVSHITAFEAECLLKRKPDGVLPNGLKLSRSSNLQDFQNLHDVNKRKILQFVTGHFCGQYDFDLDQTVVFFIAGRREYRNKGVDMFIESLRSLTFLFLIIGLNVYLKQCNSTVTVVAFIIMPGSICNFNVETLKRQAIMRQIQGTVSEISRNIEARLLDNTLRGITSYESLISSDEQVRIRRHILNLPCGSMPPIVTHNLIDDSDIIIQELRKADLINRREDRVKVIYHPEFLNVNNPVLPMDYEEFVRGCHLGVFPSYYEPWGYTPAECAIFGVPSVTSNLSGFGCFIEEIVENPADHGIYIVDRRNKSVEESVVQLTEILNTFCHKSDRARYILRSRTERLSVALDWNNLILDYLKAQRLASLKKEGSQDGFQYQQKSESHKIRATSPLN